MKMKRFMFTLRIVVSVLHQFKIRTILAIMGVLLGTLAVIIVANLSGSMEKKVQMEVDKFGDRLITVSAEEAGKRGRPRIFASSVQTMKMTDIDDINRSVASDGDVAPYTSNNSMVRSDSGGMSTRIVGAPVNIFALKNMELTEGRLYTPEEEEMRERVVVLGSEVAEKLFPDGNAVGQTVLIYRAPFHVIGVLDSMGTDLTGTSMDNLVVMPLDTMMRRASNRDYLDGFMIRLSSWDDYPVVKEQITRILRRNHNIDPNVKGDDFSIINPVEAVEMRNETLEMVSFLGMVTAGISYLIGGLGIFSIMVLVVQQRKMEIGIKRAVGATRRDVLTQFLIEAGFIGFTGGIAGVLFGLLVSVAIFTVASLPFSFSVGGFLFAFVSSALIGIISGVYPAVLASRVNPVTVIKG